MSLAARRIQPLSQRLPAILAYPLGKSMLWMFAGLCALRLLNHLPSFLGLLFEVAFWVMGFKLAVEALVNTAQGRFEPLGSNDLMATDGEAWQQMVLLLFVFAPILAVAAWFGLAPALLLLALAVMVVPAAVILLAIDQSLPHAINPLAWGALVSRLGGAYLLAVAVLAVLMVVAIMVHVLLAMLLPSNIEQLPGSFVSLYVLVAGYHLLGYLIHEHHEALGLDIAPAVPRATFANPVEDEAMADAEALAGQGKPGAAADRLQDLFRGRGASDAVHDQYHLYVIAEGDKARLAKHAREYISSLLATDKDRRALAVFSETQLRIPDFRLELADNVARLVAQATKTGQSQLAVTLATDFETIFPGDEHTPQVVLAAATLMADKLGREEAARERLQACLRAWPEHALSARLGDALVNAERLAVISRGARAV